jgi:spoIIIJ-associated protein
MQYLVSMALKSKDMEVTRVNVDIADYKKQRAHRLEERAEAWLNEVKESGQEKHLEPMNGADRRTIHKLAGEHGIQTESEGEGRERHIVLKPLTEPKEE